MKKNLFTLLMLTIAIFLFNGHVSGSGLSHGSSGFSPLPSCYPPTGVQAVSTSSVSAIISWSAPAVPPADGYEYEVRTTSGQVLVASGTVTSGLYVSVTGLTALTGYDAKVRSVCGGGDYSSWTTTSFTTSNCTLSSIPYLENFESYTPPAYGCLTIQDVNQDAVTWYTSSNSANSGTKKISIGASYPPDPMDDWVFTNGLDLLGNRSYKVSFAFRAKTSSFTERMEVKWGNGPMASMMNSPAIYSNSNINNAPYQVATATFTTPPVSGAYWVGWHCFSLPNKAGIFLDDLSLCILPDVADTIYAPEVVCKPDATVVFSVEPLADATSYVWTVPPGASIVGPNNSNSITVDFPAGSSSGDVTVYGVNSCGNGSVYTQAVVVHPQLAAEVNISGTFSTVCEGESITFTAVPTNGGSSPSYQWQVNGIDAGTDSTGFTYVPLDNDVVTCIMTSNYICSIENPDTSNALDITVIPQLVVGSISASQTICEFHTPALLAATEPSTGHTPSYQWQSSNDGINFSDIPGATNKDYQPGALTDTTWYRQYQNALVTCSGPMLTNSIKITVIPTVGTPTPIALVSGTDPVCQLTNGTTTTSYSTSATNSTSFNWSLSDNNAGSINSSGLMTWADGFAGIVKIQVTANGCNGPSSMVDYTVDVTPTVGTPTTITVSGGTEPSCQLVNATTTTTYATTSTNNTGFNWSVSDPAAGSIDPVTGVMTWNNGYYGSVDIQVTANGCNGPSAQTVRTVVVIATVGNPVFELGETSVICQNSGTVTYTANATTTTGITYSLDATSLANGNTIDAQTGAVTYHASWSGTSVITASAAGCNGPATAYHTVTITPTVGTPTTITISSGSQPSCQLTNGTTTTTYATTATDNTGFNWSLSNPAAGSIEATTGIMTWANGFAGSVDIQVTANGCNGPSAQTIHTVNITPTVGTPTAITVGSGVEPVCQIVGSSTTTTYATTATDNTGFNWSLSNPAAGSINPSSGVMTWANGFYGSVDIRVTANGCNGPSAQVYRTVNITATVGVPVFTLGSTSLVCQNPGTITYTANATTTTGITYSLDATSLANGNTIDAQTGAVTYSSSWSGTSVITASAAGCNGPATASHTVTITPTVGTPTAITISSGTQPTCQLTNGTTTTTYTTTATNNTGFNWSLSNPAAGSIGSTTGIMTWANGFAGSVDIQVTANGCNGPSAQTIRTVNITSTVGTPTDITVSAGTEPTCQIVGSSTTTTYATTATNSTGFNWSVSNPSAGTINSSGVMTWSNGFYGSVNIRVTASGCNGPSSQVSRLVTITQTVGTPSFTLGASSVRCQGSGNVTYQASATTTTGITYSLDAASLSAGNTINPATGEVTYVAGWSGIAEITASAAGCNGPVTAKHTATTTATVGVPTAITVSAGTEPTCQLTNGTTTTTYATTATNSTGFNWSVSDPAAGSIGSTTGIMTWANAFAGSVDIRVTANGCNGPSAQIIRTVVITPTVGTPAAITIFAGSDPVCQLTNATTTTTYATTATNNTGFNWSLSNPLAGSIGAATGLMTWANGFSGSVDIQVTANGCNGPSSMVTYTVNVTPTVGTPTDITVSAGTEPVCHIPDNLTTTTYATTSTNSTGFTWSIDNPLAGSINPSTGVMTWTMGFVGTVNIQVVALGCNGPSAMTTRTVVINPNLPVSVSIGRSANNVCAGTLVTFTATAVNPGNNPVYQWKKNGVNFGSNNHLLTYAAANADTVTCELTSNALCATGSPAISNMLVMDIVPVVPVSVTVTPSSNPSCNGQQVTYTAAPVNGGELPAYQWTVNGQPVGTNSDTYAYVPANGEIVRCQVTSSLTCVSGNPATSPVLTMVVNPVLTASVSISSNLNNICAGTQVTFTAVPTNGGGAPLYQWKLGDADITGATNATYAYAPANGDVITCVMTSSVACPVSNPVTSNSVSMVVYPLNVVSVTVTPSANPSCVGSSVTFTATPVNGGATPSYQWRLNGNRAGTNSPQFTYVPANNDVITCRVTSSLTQCVSGSPAVSAPVPMTVLSYVPAGVSITASTNPVCEGHEVNMTATPVNGGSLPSYQWRLNEANIPGATNANYSFVPAEEDAVNCIMTSNFTCVTGNPATSNTIVLNLQTPDNVSISIAASANPSPTGAMVTYTATGIGGGTNPVYQWYVNSAQTGTNSPTFDYTPANGDEVYCIFTSNATCTSGNPATSNTIVMKVAPENTSATGVIIHNGESLCFDAINNIITAGDTNTFLVEAGGSAILIAGQSILLMQGTTVVAGGYLHGYISTDFCGSLPPPITAVISGSGEKPEMVSQNKSYSLYPNPTKGMLTMAVHGGSTEELIRVEIYSMQGKRMLSEEFTGRNSYQLRMADIPDGLYFVRIMSNGQVETVKVIKSR